MRIRIGDLLVKAGVITELQLKAALAEQLQWGGKLGDILIRMEFLTEEVLVRALSKQTGIARADLSGDNRLLVVQCLANFGYSGSPILADIDGTPVPEYLEDFVANSLSGDRARTR